MGGASSVVSLLDKGIGLGVEEQAGLVPIQRQVIELELARQNEQAQSNSPNTSGAGGRRQNPRASMGGGAGGGKMDETVKYINESEN